jgi:hypothetical protein
LRAENKEESDSWSHCILTELAKLPEDGRSSIHSPHQKLEKVQDESQRFARRYTTQDSPRQYPSNFRVKSKSPTFAQITDQL